MASALLSRRSGVLAKPLRSLINVQVSFLNPSLCVPSRSFAKRAVKWNPTSSQGSYEERFGPIHDQIAQNCEEEGDPIREQFEDAMDEAERAQTYLDEDAEGNEDLENWKEQFVTHVIGVDAVSKTQSKGRKRTLRVMVVSGNGKGACGFGIGRSEERETAALAAKAMSFKNMVSTELYRGRALYQDLMGRSQRNTKVVIRQVPLGGGFKGSDMMMLFCDAMGIQDASVKVIGRRNRINVAQAFFDAIKRHRSAEQISLARGLPLRNVFDNVRATMGRVHPKY